MTEDGGWQGPVFVPPAMRDGICENRTGTLYAAFRAMTIAIDKALNKGEL